MKVLILFLFLATLYLVKASEFCLNNKEECHSTNYQTYVDCVRMRQKRSTDCYSGCNSGNCINTCNNCDCDSCNYNSCGGGSCNECCSSCCSNYVPCHTNHCCHKTCHAQCSSSSCRSDCRRNCFDTVKEITQEVISKQDLTNTSITNVNKPNITTIIHLNNVINNTNIVDVPISINNTNIQNITLHNQGSNGGSTSEMCCTVISPRQCVATPVPRCFHYRSKQCGAFCTASIVHKEQHEVCSVNYPGAQPSCSQQIIYIPQPQPRCTYQSVWPYVSCGIQKEQACQGCYSHYVNSGSTNYLSCPSQCYDDGFGAMGSFYRQGPVYKPWYSHTPCYECLGYPNNYNGMLYQSANGGYMAPNSFYPYGQPGYGVPQYASYPFNHLLNNNDSISVLNPLNPIYGQQGEIVMEPGEINQSQYQDQLYDGRLPREVEIDVNYEPASNAQAEVKIQTDQKDKSDYDWKDDDEDEDTDNVDNS